MIPAYLRLKRLAITGILLGVLIGQTIASEITYTDVYTSGTYGYAIFRIPAIVKTSSGTLLAFAEGRRDSGSDTGKIDTVLRRSLDNGRTWGPLQVVWTDGDNTCGNPAPVIDRTTGRIVLLGTWNRGDDHEKEISAGTATDTRRVFVSESNDDGVTWRKHRDITSEVKKADWGWYATGPCHGIQLNDGRLVIPANHTPLQKDLKRSHSHIIFSDDGGQNWQLGGIAAAGTNESTVAELSSGGLVLNMRSYHKQSRRAQAVSSDRGLSWSETRVVPELIEPVCQGSLLRVNLRSDDVYVFSNPASIKRENLTLRLSIDGCQTWSDGLLLQKGFSAYSDLVDLPDETIGCLYEKEGDAKPYGRITFARLPISLLFPHDN